MFRSSHQNCSIKRGVLKNIAKSTWKHLCQCLFFNKVKRLRPAFLLKKSLWYRCLSVSFAEFILKNTANGCFWMFRCIPSKIIIKSMVFWFSGLQKGNISLKWVKPLYINFIVTDVNGFSRPNIIVVFMSMASSKLLYCILHG